MSRLNVLAAGTAALLLFPARLPAQSAPFQPFPAGTESLYHFDLSRTLFSTPESERTQRADVLALASRAAELAPSASSSATALLRMLRTADSAELRLNRHYAYLTLRGAIDRRDEAATSESNALFGAAQQSLGRVARVLASLDPAQFERLRRAEPGLARYAFAVTQARGATASTSASDEPAVTQWRQIIAAGPARFQAVNRSIDFGTVQTPDGPLDVRTQGGQILSHPERSVREAGYRRNTLGLASRRDTFADILTSVARARNALAKTRGFADYREESYGERYLTVATVHGILTALRSAAPENKAYERFRAERLKQQFGYATVHWWDLMAPSPGRTVPLFRIDEATTVAVAAARPLGSAYASELAAVLDPRNGRLDVAPGPYKVERPGFSTGVVGYPSHVYQGRYSGLVGDLIILAHEAGHAAQNMMMDRRGVLPRYAFGPGYFTESYATLSELLVLEHLARSTPDTALRIYYMERLLDQASGMYRTGFESMLEDSLYALVGAGQMPRADEIERLHHGIASQFSIWYGPGSDVTLGWVQPLQFYTRPLYRVNYVVATLLALNYVRQLKTDPDGFQRRYQSLLSRGYDATPAELLRQEMDINFDDAERLIATANDVIREWRRELTVLTERR